MKFKNYEWQLKDVNAGVIEEEQNITMVIDGVIKNLGTINRVKLNNRLCDVKKDNDPCVVSEQFVKSLPGDVYLQMLNSMHEKEAEEREEIKN